MAYALQAELNKNLTLAAWIKTTNSTRSEAFISKYETAIGYGYVLEDDRRRQPGSGSWYLQRCGLWQ